MAALREPGTVVQAPGQRGIEWTAISIEHEPAGFGALWRAEVHACVPIANSGGRCSARVRRACLAMLDGVGEVGSDVISINAWGFTMARKLLGAELAELDPRWRYAARAE